MRKYIIIVEDNADHADLIKLSLKKINNEHDILHLNDGQEVLDFFRKLSEDEIEPVLPDLLIMDLRMPRIGGLEVLEELKASDKYRAIPIVILTSSENSQDIKAAYEKRANSYLIKPVEFSELNKLLASAHDYWLTQNKTAYNLD